MGLCLHVPQAPSIQQRATLCLDVPNTPTPTLPPPALRSNVVRAGGGRLVALGAPHPHLLIASPAAAASDPLVAAGVAAGALAATPLYVVEWLARPGAALGGHALLGRCVWVWWYGGCHGGGSLVGCRVHMTDPCVCVCVFVCDQCGWRSASQAPLLRRRVWGSMCGGAGEADVGWRHNWRVWLPAQCTSRGQVRGVALGHLLSWLPTPC